MEDIEQLPNTISHEENRRHVPRARTLTQRTHDCLLRGETLTPDLYRDTFPEGETIVDGARAAYDTLEKIYEEGTTTKNADRLITLFRRANMLSQYLFEPFVGTVAGTFTLEVNEILGKQNWLSVEDADASGMQKELPYPRSEVAQSDDAFPWEYHAVVNAFALMHEDTTHYFPPPISGLIRVSSALSYSKFGGSVSSALLARIAQHADEATYFAACNKLPYKQILFKKEPTYEKDRQEADEHIKHFEDIMQGGGEKYYPRSLSKNMWRKGNYDAAMRLTLGGYLSFRKAGLDTTEAVKRLYGHGARFRMYTAAVTDAMPFASHDDSTFLLSDICKELVTVDWHDEEPILDLSRIEPLPQAALSPDVSASVKAAYARKRQFHGRCPARHTVAPISGAFHKDNISEFSNEIRERAGVDPAIFTPGGDINPTSLIMAMAIRQSERFNLFNVLDKRVAMLDL